MIKADEYINYIFYDICMYKHTEIEILLLSGGRLAYINWLKRQDLDEVFLQTK